MDRSSSVSPPIGTTKFSDRDGDGGWVPMDHIKQEESEHKVNKIHTHRFCFSLGLGIFWCLLKISLNLGNKTNSCRSPYQLRLTLLIIYYRLTVATDCIHLVPLLQLPIQQWQHLMVRFFSFTKNERLTECLKKATC